jgi:hypothetical protein
MRIQRVHLSHLTLPPGPGGGPRFPIPSTG